MCLFVQCVLYPRTIQILTVWTCLQYQLSKMRMHYKRTSTIWVLRVAWPWFVFFFPCSFHIVLDAGHWCCVSIPKRHLYCMLRPSVCPCWLYLKMSRGVSWHVCCRKSTCFHDTKKHDSMLKPLRKKEPEAFYLFPPCFQYASGCWSCPWYKMQYPRKAIIIHSNPNSLLDARFANHIWLLISKLWHHT